ncbi:adenosylmethionine--8-amino-7-oxononanoate transaminase [Rickettsiales endosymbiont of Stachyamoeba lipophora]|uniref:adenosylmethionine--8-amino-7-oxononanoate transaminase n=1 Tax=Rickettsiales endosymbiont of Stachyamoeba lipophora TaxID=2486578 RepID=UPI000F647711|nr:adenosylmethionine--8-amino-7-oxononanoate transaminase [Rickettsiales endosymbiont of Stachyamoeba lipophora]AZL16074.1 adenosylmethionine--8-amino-7-oxononanoate transaminase [Rickettsiales endosymbiont of Stachyamoeba lipophora]
MQPELTVRDDNNLVWQSYAQMNLADTPLMIKSAQGVYLTLENGKRMIDGISSWWSTCHGHAHPYIVSKVVKQVNDLPHIMFAGLAHNSVYELSKKLIKILPQGLEHFVYCESGSVAVEIALKIALQYYSNQRQYRSKFIYFENSYHGDTIGCSIVTDDNTITHQFAKKNEHSIKSKLPQNKQDLADFDRLLSNNKEQIAAVIIEPIFQGAGGMKFHTPEILAEIYKITKKYGLLFIADEIATGFYRTGKYFACDHASITPDIICLGKGITSGVIPFAAVGTTDEVFFSFYSDNPEYALKHGTTFAANPLGCMAAIGSIELFEQKPRKLQVANMSDQLKSQLEPLKKHHKVKEVRVLGAIGAVELDCSIKDILLMRSLIRKKEAWLRPFGNVLYTMPPFITNQNEISTITQTIESLVLTI